MAKKNTAGPRIAARRNPLFLENTPLDFDNYSEEELLALTPQEEADRFLSRWQETFDPFNAYPKVFRRGEKAADRILREIKLYFRKYVVEGEWSERKYVMVVNSILEARGLINNFSLDKTGKLYDSESLPVQVRLKRDQKRGR